MTGRDDNPVVTRRINSSLLAAWIRDVTTQSPLVHQICVLFVSGLREIWIETSKCVFLKFVGCQRNFNVVCIRRVRPIQAEIQLYKLLSSLRPFPIPCLYRDCDIKLRFIFDFEVLFTYEWWITELNWRNLFPKDVALVP